MTPRKKRIAFIGTGGRANSYAQWIDRSQADFVACADVSEHNRQAFLALNKIDPASIQQYRGWEEMFDRCGELDGVVITTPNFLHTDPAVEAMRRGYALALEKPIAESAENCRRLLEARRTYDARMIIGFVMRSSPFYQTLAQHIHAGRIGGVVTVQADEIVHLLTVAVMFRSDWRRFVRTSGGSLLEKACHDIDMLNWISGGKPLRVNSFAGHKSLKPRADVPARCDECHLTRECVYYLPKEVYGGPARTWGDQDADLYKVIKDSGSCIYNNGHDVYDHQVVQIEYDNGALVNFTLDFSAVGQAASRHIKVIGTEGVIWGRLDDYELHLQSKRTNTVETLKVSNDGSGHGGANRNHGESFLRLMQDPDYCAPATFEAGYASAMLCFAADQSVRERRQIDVSHLAQEVDWAEVAPVERNGVGTPGATGSLPASALR